MRPPSMFLEVGVGEERFAAQQAGIEGTLAGAGLSSVNAEADCTPSNPRLQRLIVHRRREVLDRGA